MISEADIYRSAQVMRREHGDAAIELAQAHATKHWDAGDDEGAAIWIQIANAIEELQRMAPEDGKSRH